MPRLCVYRVGVFLCTTVMDVIGRVEFGTETESNAGAVAEEQKPVLIIFVLHNKKLKF